jgi:peptidoglycan/xylan/chitin deacetylase (PgdA/CDA1 family)
MNLRSIQIVAAQKISRVIWSLDGQKQFIGKSIPVLSYHRVLPGYIEKDAPMYSVLPEQFAEQMQYLSSNAFVSLSLDEYEQIIKGEKDVPERSILITFDDGYADFYSQALPIAKQYGITLNVFVCTGLVEGSTAEIYPEIPAHAREHREAYPELWRPLNWDEIRKLKAEGVGIGFHGHSHRKLAKMTVEEIALEFEMGLNLYRHETNYEMRHFAFPHGTYDSYDTERVALISSLGMQLQFSTRLSRTPVDANEALISRLVIHQEDDLETYKLKLFGAYEWLGALRHWNQKRKFTPEFQPNQDVTKNVAEKVMGESK